MIMLFFDCMQKIKKDIKGLDNTVNELYLIDRTLYPHTLQAHMEDLPKLIINFDQLGHKTGMFSTHSRIYLEINQKKYENLTNM